MGVTMTKAQPVAAARKKKHKPGFLPVIHEYVPKPHQLRSKSLDLHYRRNDKLTSLAQYGRSATMFDVGSQSSAARPATPQWQRKWEQDMRPEPTVIKLETLPHLRAWNSMPLPTSDISAYFSDYNENIRRSSNAQKESRRSKWTIHGYIPKQSRTTSRQATPLSDDGDLDIVDKMSISSTSVDRFKWLHKTEARTDKYLNSVNRLWYSEQRRGSKQWFLGQDTKVEQETVPKPRKRRTRFRMKQTPRLPAIRVE